MYFLKHEDDIQLEVVLFSEIHLIHVIKGKLSGAMTLQHSVASPDKPHINDEHYHNYQLTLPDEFFQLFLEYLELGDTEHGIELEQYMTEQLNELRDRLTPVLKETDQETDC